MMYDIIRFASYQLHFEEPELRVYRVELVDDCANGFVFLKTVNSGYDSEETSPHI